MENVGYDVLTADSGVDALAVIGRSGMPHLAIVDINMPLMNGFDFCEAVQQFSDLPVIMLSAQDEEDTIIKSISNYAEDYVTKPFSPRELLARVERVLRRIGDFGYTLGVTTTIDDRLTVDFAHQSALVAGRSIFLTPTETKLLYLLIRNAGRVVTADFLLRRLWPMEEMFEDTLASMFIACDKKSSRSPANRATFSPNVGWGTVFRARNHHVRLLRNHRCNINGIYWESHNAGFTRHRPGRICRSHSRYYLWPQDAGL